jgi:hypothetical protein
MYGARRNLTGGGTQGTFVPDLCLVGQATSPRSGAPDVVRNMQIGPLFEPSPQMGEF